MSLRDRPSMVVVLIRVRLWLIVYSLLGKYVLGFAAPMPSSSAVGTNISGKYQSVKVEFWSVSRTGGSGAGTMVIDGSSRIVVWIPFHTRSYPITPNSGVR